MTRQGTATDQAQSRQPERLTLTKKALSLYFRVKCERQFLLYLYNDTARSRLGLPPRQEGRAGLGLVGRAGYEWEAKKIAELSQVFGAANVHINPIVQSNRQLEPLSLESVIGTLRPYQFIVQPSFSAETDVFRTAVRLGTLRDANGLRLDLGELRPDLIQALPPLGAHQRDNIGLPPSYLEDVEPDGTTWLVDPAVDSRIRLRVLDIKLTSEPGAHYFAEVVFYSMALSAWLEERGLADRFSVAAAPGVVPGSLDDSNLIRLVRAHASSGQRSPAPHELTIALDEDLEIAPVEVFAPRIRDLIADTLPRLLQTPWQNTAYHVDFRCKGCEFLGDPHIVDRTGRRTQHPDHCWPTAELTDHLSRVVGLSRGAADALEAKQIQTVAALAQIGQTAQAHPAFQEHHGLKAKRTVFPSRAEALQNRGGSVIPESGGDALMPRWPDLHIYLFLDYDPATGMTMAFGCRAFWKEPLPYGSQLQPQQRRWGRTSGDTEVFPTDKPEPSSEWREFQKLLRHLREILRAVQNQDRVDVAAQRRDRKTSQSSYQIYLWDEAQHRHLVRLVSRYLPLILADAQLLHMAWLFPPPELLAHPENETRKSPFTLVHDVVANTIALPDPHHYTLLGVAQSFNATPMSAPSVHPLYRESFSNLVPPERIHECWAKVGNWVGVLDLIVETVGKKLLALGLVVSSLERRLGPALSRLSAPPVPVPPNRPGGLSAVGHLWHEYTRLNAALESLDVHRTRAMPAHERAARFKSARLTRRLSGAERQRAIQRLVASAGRALASPPSLLVYELAKDSTEFNARPGDFGYALAPEDDPGFLDRHPYTLTRNTTIQAYGGDTVEAVEMTAVSIEAIDRGNGLIALLPGFRNRIRELTRHGIVDFSKNVVLDPIHKDYISAKVRLTLQGVGNPPTALPPPRVLQALGLPRNTSVGRTEVGPAAEVLWQPSQLHVTPAGRDTSAIRRHLQQHLTSRGLVLLPDQWQAFEAALGENLTLIWGPPGTGKSYTMRAIVLGAVWAAVESGRRLRLLISANTYTAVDNVLLKLQDELGALLPAKRSGDTRYRLYRVQSSYRPVEHDFQVRYSGISNIELNKINPDLAAQALIQLLGSASGNDIVIVGAPTQQLHNMAVAGVRNPTGRHTQREWFDLILLDEATQVDVAASTLVLSKRASGGACVFGGDDLQLPPIHQADAPTDLDAMVGSIYSYLATEHQIQPVALNVSFRSNRTLVDFTRTAGYSPSLRPHSPQLRLNLAPVGEQQPANWPAGLHWTPAYPSLVDPDKAAAAVVYEDRRSAQSNEFEGEVIAGITWLLRAHMLDGLLNELDPQGQRIRDNRYSAPRPQTSQRFWEEGLGVVVPHRAQMSLVAGRLQALFPQDGPDLIRSSVDTVERFQGQQRDVVIASFGLGDPDVIAAEEEFLYDLRRFNVMASRARVKLIVLATRSLLEHLSDDTDVLAESTLLKRFVEQFCQHDGWITLVDKSRRPVHCELRQWVGPG